MPRWFRITLNLFLVLFVTAIGTILFVVPEMEIEISETEVREGIAKSLPVTHTDKGMTTVVKGADIQFLADGRLRLDAFFDVQGYGFAGTGEAHVTSGLRYENGAFYLADVDIDDLDITPSSDSEEKAGDLKTAAKGIWNTVVGKAVGEDADAGAALQRLKDRFLPAATEAARATLDKSVKTFPVYDLKDQDITQRAAILALEDVTFRDGAAVVHLSLRGALLKLLGYAVAGTFAMLASLGAVLGLFHRPR